MLSGVKWSYKGRKFNVAYILGAKSISGDIYLSMYILIQVSYFLYSSVNIVLKQVWKVQLFHCGF